MILWTFPTQGEIWSSPAVKDGIVYFGSDDQSVYAVSVKTQKLKWQFPTEAIVRSVLLSPMGWSFSPAMTVTSLQ